MPGARARSALAGTRFADVRWVAETGSTNADAMALAQGGAPEGVVLVADHQTAGRGRAGRGWSAPPGSSLLASILLRPPAPLADLVTMAVAVAAAEAVAATAGFAPRLKWPNDLVWPGDGTAADRKLAGILAEADWAVTARRPSPAAARPGPEGDGPGTGSPASVAVVVGIGINCTWPEVVPPELAGVAVAANHVTGAPLDREDLLAALLRRLDEHYGRLVASGDRGALLAGWRARSATLGRPVRVEQATGDWAGVAVDVTDAGHLVVEAPGGERRTFAVGDVVHLRPG